jgi:hypothetical protein
LDKRSVGGEGYGLGRDIDHRKLDELLSHHNLPPFLIPDAEQPAANLDALVEDMCVGMTYDAECEEEDVVN